MPPILTDAFEAYILALRRTPLDQHTEMTGRGALEALLNRFKPAKATVIHEPKRAQSKGAPDFKISQAGQVLGYVENKAVGENLDAVLKSEQIKKYQTLSGNIIVTDYLRWVWLKDGKAIADVRLGEPGLLEDRKAYLHPERVSEVQALITGFFSEPVTGISRAKTLAEALAVRSQLLRDFLGAELVRQKEADEGGQLIGLFGAFQKQVSHELTLAEFADAFAQTLAYGLFLAKLNDAANKEITLANAKTFIPHSVGLIRELVGFLDNLDRPEYADIAWVIEEVLSIINGLKLAQLLEDLSFRNRKARRGTQAGSEEEWRLFSRDPFIYFYEDYLGKYDAKLKKSRGVYYTPPPIVNFIIRAIHGILKDSFGIPTGLADHKRVTVLDFACGTGTFLVEILEQIFEEIGPDSGKAGQVVSDHILKNIFGFEYLIAPYTIAHLKLGQYLADKGHKLKDDERFQVYLTNTLEPIQAERNYLVPELSHETELAQEVKEKPILVITGNPPYSGHSRNNGPVAKASVEAYREGIPELSKPAQGKWLQDDYVKFIRFAQSKMDAVDEGVVGIITNHSFLDNLTFRGMRASLMRSFDQIFVIDLHGNAKKKETSPDGGKDENVFDIEQGVAISLFVKKPGVERGVWRADAWGKRQEKYEWAASAGRGDVEWFMLQPTEPQFLFVERDNDAEASYRELWSVPEILDVNGDPAPGVVTTHDEFAISFTENEAIGKVEALVATPTEKEARNLFRLCKQNQWSYDSAKKELSRLNLQGNTAELSYLPFDTRWTIWNRNVAVHLRERVSEHLKHPNIGLLTIRRQEAAGAWTHVFAVAGPSGHHALSSKEVNYVLPLYLYPPSPGAQRSVAMRDLFGDGHNPFAGKERIENIDANFRIWIDARYGKTYTPEQILGCIYAILHAPAYRARYADFLRTDFPRIPFPEKAEDFETLATLGWDLIQAHLMEAVPKRGLGTYRGKGDNVVGKPRYSPAEHAVWINDANHFIDVPQAVWEFTIGGYQVIDKYLKSRKGRTLSLDEIENVEKVVNILDFTIEQMGKIDEAYSKAFA